MSSLHRIPVVDASTGGPVALAQRHAAELEMLRAACLSFLPRGSGPGVGVADRLARRWLRANASPYAEEVAAIAALARGSGVHLVNTCYEWACTTATRPERSAPPLLMRTLDWPFPGLGRGVMIVRQSGPAGPFWNVTWPGAVGVLTAMAPGRFAATINQAPLYRRTRGELLRACDYAVNAVHTYWRVRHAPPAHILRQVFEEAEDYEAAKTLLGEIPVARPVLFSLIGARPGQACVIERTCQEASLHEGEVLVANDWQQPRRPWEPRAAGGPVETDSRDRRAALRAAAEAGGPPFAWLRPPVHNWATRLAVEMSAGEGVLRVIGFEPAGGQAPAVRATEMFDLARERIAA